MPPIAATPAAAGIPAGSAARWVLALATLASFLVVFQNFGMDILPDRRVEIPAGRIRPYSSEATFAYVFDFNGSEPDRWPSDRSRVKFYEDDHPYLVRLHQVDEVILVGGDRFAHEPGRIVFATTDNSDPRTNGRRYWLMTPILYRAAIGDGAVLVFLYCMAVWWLVSRDGPRAPDAARVARRHWRLHLSGATLLFLFGLYCNTGTLAPYGNTCAPMYIPQDTGYVYNQDHPYFRVLFDFVDGKGRAVWDGAELLRRILFPVLGWPLMRLFGFELGGTMTSLALNVGGFIGAALFIRRWIGERGAVFAMWVMALYPGAAYWAGMPYSYALIFPGSLFLMFGICRILDTTVGWRFAGISLAMGVAYLGYDFAAFFVPAAVFALCWRRRFAAAALSALLQAAPLAIWLFVLKHVFGQSLETANSASYRNVLLSYLHSGDSARWLQEILHAPDVGFDIFFAANFIFLPALFLVALAVNPITSRIRFRVAEVALLFAALAVFLVLNLAPSESSGWALGGTWISRLYQPVFPALLLYTARWWQDLPPLSRAMRTLIGAALAVASLGNALIVFGPILDNPGKISEAAFYRFYDHTDAHFVYESTLRTLGRRPLGFPQAQAPAPTQADLRALSRRQLARELGEIDNLRKAIEGNRAALIANQKAYLDVGRSLAAARSALLATQLEIRRKQGEITAEEATRQAKPWNDFVSPGLRGLLEHPPSDAHGPVQGAETPQTLPEANVEIKRESDELVDLQSAVGKAQSELSQGISDLTQAQSDLDRAKKVDASLKGN